MTALWTDTVRRMRPAPPDRVKERAAINAARLLRRHGYDAAEIRRRLWEGQGFLAAHDWIAEVAPPARGGAVLRVVK